MVDIKGGTLYTFKDCCSLDDAQRAVLSLGMTIYCKLTNTLWHEKKKIVQHVQYFFQSINIEQRKGYKSKLTSVVKSGEVRLGEANFMTVRDYGSLSPSCCDISHHCQFSHFRVRPAGYSSSADSRGSCWMKEDRDIYGQRKQISQLPVVGSTSVDIDHWWPSLFMTGGFKHLC